MYPCLLFLLVLGVIVAGGIHLSNGRSNGRPDRRADGLSYARPWTPAPRTEVHSGPPLPEHAVDVPARRSVTLRYRAIRLPGPGFVSWALLDRRTGAVTGSGNLRSPGSALATIKPWLAADHLRRVTARGHVPTVERLRQLRAVVRGANNTAADALYRELGGAASIRRLVRRCGLTDTRPDRGYWSGTITSARDTVKLGACLADGHAAGDRWTSWLLREMRRVRGDGDFGVRTALPPQIAARVAVRNGWLLRTDGLRWQVTCLAVDAEWVLGVLTRYPGRLGLRHGKHLCRAVGGQLITMRR